jgi:hypothetical protein
VLPPSLNQQIIIGQTMKLLSLLSQSTGKQHGSDTKSMYIRGEHVGKFPGSLRDIGSICNFFLYTFFFYILVPSTPWMDGVVIVYRMAWFCTRPFIPNYQMLKSRIAQTHLNYHHPIET